MTLVEHRVSEGGRPVDDSTFADQMERLHALEGVDPRARWRLLAVIGTRHPDVLDEALTVLERRHAKGEL